MGHNHTMALENINISPARTPAELDRARGLFRAYAASLPVDLAHQGFDAELANLPGKYAPPLGELLLAYAAPGMASSLATGCVALRPLEPPGVCEMKRLFVAPPGRGLGLGRALAETIMRIAKQRGYSEIKLDTLSSLHAALRLYEDLGFQNIPAYYDSPFAGTVFLSRKL